MHRKGSSLFRKLKNPNPADGRAGVIKNKTQQKDLTG